MADVLYYAALDKYLYADTQLAAAQDQATRAVNRFNTANSTVTSCQTCLNCCKCCYCCEEYAKVNASDGLEALTTLNTCLRTDLMRGRTCYCQAWNCIPDSYVEGASGITTIWVADETVANPGCCTCSGYWRCGYCCQFTVPSGVSKVQFTGWGPGNSSGASPGCGGSPYGGTGAFFTVNLPVTAGEQYTVCAGWAYCCYPGNGDTYYTYGGPTYVQGPGMCNVCADPGRHSFMQVVSFQGGTSCCCRAAAPWCWDSGGCWCSCSTFYCFDNSCASCGHVGNVSNRMYAYGCSPRSVIYKVSGHWGGWCYDTNHYGFVLEPGVPFMCNANYNGTCCVGCCFDWTSGTCYGKCCAACCTNQSGWRRWPGLGGTMTHTMGGNSNCGDSGRMGAVRITYQTP